jgi:hypothetical protein
MADLSSPTHDTISSLANTATYGGSGAAILFGLNANELAALAGVVIAIVGLVISVAISVSFKRLERKDRLAHNKIMQNK